MVLLSLGTTSMTKTQPNTARKPRRAPGAPEQATPHDAGSVDSGADADESDGQAAPHQRTTKTRIVLDLLRCEQGALLADIIAATGWQPHTARAALTGLKKKGHTITSTKVDKVTCYKLA